jgi:hypothetical protein
MELNVNSYSSFCSEPRFNSFVYISASTKPLLDFSGLLVPHGKGSSQHPSPFTFLTTAPVLCAVWVACFQTMGPMFTGYHHIIWVKRELPPQATGFFHSKTGIFIPELLA